MHGEMLAWGLGKNKQTNKTAWECLFFLWSMDTLSYHAQKPLSLSPSLLWAEGAHFKINKSMCNTLIHLSSPTPSWKQERIEGTSSLMDTFSHASPSHFFFAVQNPLLTRVKQRSALLDAWIITGLGFVIFAHYCNGCQCALASEINSYILVNPLVC